MWARKTPLQRGNSTLKRQPFKQKFTVTTKVDDDEIEKPPMVVSRPELFRNPEMIGSEVIALPKPVKRVSPALREFASQKQCLLQVPGICNFDWTTTIACHGNSQRFGKATGRKADDCYMVWGCFCCHIWLDSKKDVLYEDRQSQFDLALVRQFKAYMSYRSVTGLPVRYLNAINWAIAQYKQDGILNELRQNSREIVFTIEH